MRPRRTRNGHRGPWRNLLLAVAGALLFAVGYLLGSRYMAPAAGPSPLVLLAEPLDFPEFELHDASGRRFGPGDLRGQWQLLIPYRTDRLACERRVRHSIRVRNRLAGRLDPQPGFWLLYLRLNTDSGAGDRVSPPRAHPAVHALRGSPEAVDTLLKTIGLADPAQRLEPCRTNAPYTVIDPSGRARALLPASLAPGPAAEALDQLMNETEDSMSTTVEPGLKDRLLTGLLKRLPQHRLSAAMHWLARLEWPPLKNALIRFVVWRYGVNVGEAANTDLASYPSFNAFFTRQLKPDARPLDTGPRALLSPVDGRISQIGRIESGRLLQAKGVDYSLQELLGGDPALSAQFADGHFATVYLSPRDYHRIHMPADGSLRRMDFVPGDLYSVSEATVQLLPNLFARNERTLTVFEGARGPFAVILVGAIFVGSMETVWHGEVRAQTPGRIARWNYEQEPPRRYRAGEEMGRFNMGSTVILLFPPGQVSWDETLRPGDPVRLGQKLGDFVV